MGVKSLIADFKVAQTEGRKAIEVTRQVGREQAEVNRQALGTLDNISSVLNNPAAQLSPEQAARAILGQGGGATVSGGQGGGGGGGIQLVPRTRPGPRVVQPNIHRVPRLLQQFASHIRQPQPRTVFPPGLQPGPEVFIGSGGRGGGGAGGGFQAGPGGGVTFMGETGPSAGESAILSAVETGFAKLETAVAGNADGGALLRANGGLTR